MSSTAAPILLRRVLLADAAVSGVGGIAMLFCAGPLGEPLGLSETFLRLVGLVLLPWAALLAYLATHHRVSRPWTLAVVGVNLLWAVASVPLLLTGWVAPTALGYAFVVGQALAVALLAELQVVGLRRAAPVPAVPSPLGRAA